MQPMKKLRSVLAFVALGLAVYSFASCCYTTQVIVMGDTGCQTKTRTEFFWVPADWTNCISSSYTTNGCDQGHQQTFTEYEDDWSTCPGTGCTGSDCMHQSQVTTTTHIQYAPQIC